MPECFPDELWNRHNDQETESLRAVSDRGAADGMSAYAADGDMQLQQVLMLSRHNLRAPLANNGSVLEQATKKLAAVGCARR